MPVSSTTSSTVPMILNTVLTVPAATSTLKPTALPMMRRPFLPTLSAAFASFLR